MATSRRRTSTPRRSTPSSAAAPKPAAAKLVPRNPNRNFDVAKSGALQGSLPMGYSLSLTLGTLLLAVMMPFTGVVVGTAVLWNFIDPLFGRADQKGGMPVPRWICRVVGPLFESMMKKKEDSFAAINILFLGTTIPALFVACLLYTVQNGFDARLAWAYHVFRIGPYFMNFAYVYTMCHKEGHSNAKPVNPGLFQAPFNTCLRHVYNWYVGLFYGVLPSTFAFGHTQNHHKYNNEQQDIVSTSDYPRDSVANLIAYLPRFFAYAINASTIYQFMKDGKAALVPLMIVGNVYWLSFVAASAWYAGPLFAAAYCVYPLFENVILLACINWCWHGFNEPEGFDNEYAASVTIFGDRMNVLNEDFHVVHHMYPARHWTEHPVLYKKHQSDYVKNVATMFRDTHVFELFFLIILKDYDQMTDLFVDPSGKMTRPQKMALIKARLRCCLWGPLTTTAAAHNAAVNDYTN